MATDAVVKESFIKKVEGEFKTDAKKVLTVLDIVGQDAEKGLAFVAKYAAPIDAIVAIAFPGVAPETTAVTTAVTLVQNAVLKVKQASAALPQGLTTAQMIADELQLVGPAVQSILAQEKISYNSTQVTNLINLVVAAINAQPVPATS